MGSKSKSCALMSIVLLAISSCLWPAGKVTSKSVQSSVVTQFNPQAYEDIPPGEGRVFWIDGQASEVHVFVWRGGPLAGEGHNHVMRVAKMDGAAFLPNDMLKHQLRFDIVFPVSGIEVDPPELRHELGGAFDSGITSEGARGTREHMLGTGVLDAQHFPTIGLSVTQAYGEPPKMALDIQISLHGLQRHRMVPVTISRDDGEIRVSGSFVIEQSDFGIKPFSALEGALYIQDPIMIQFNVVGRSH